MMWELCFALLTAAPVQSGYADVHGLKMYYELRGQGRPVLLLHGGVSTIAGTFSNQLGPLSENHRVISPEQMGHGHTADADRPFRYADMAEDTAELLHKLHVDQVDVVGWSDGGIIGLLLAAHHPELVRRLAVSGVNTRPDGLEPGTRAWLAKTSPEDWPEPIQDAYAEAFVDGAAHWPLLLNRLKAMWLDFEVKPKELGAIRAATLLIAGDHDQIRPEHTLELYRALPNAQLFIVPDCRHNTFNGKPDLVNAVLLGFLDTPPPGKP
jgi:pimeloyl-ACP methyl ester carboxylesterase